MDMPNERLQKENAELRGQLEELNSAALAMTQEMIPQLHEGDQLLREDNENLVSFTGDRATHRRPRV